MEPERPIEKLLRAFAQKRREQAGEPFELHPVNRRLLQDEVARFRRTGRAASWWGWIRNPRFASALAAAVVLGACTTLLLLREREDRSEISMASQYKDSRTQPAPLEQAADETSLSDLGLAAPAKPMEEVRTMSVAVATAVPRGDVEQDRAGRAAELAAVPSAAATDAVPEATANRSVGLAGSAAALTGPERRFRRVTDGAERGESVLQSFRLRQSNGRLQVIDADGSVYEGTIVAAPARQAFGDTTPPAQREQSFVEAFQFQVSGTNFTLRAPVLFTGAFVPPTNVVDAIAAGEDVRREAMQRPATLGGQWRVEGTVVVGTNTIQLRAEPEG
ncbi:MAG TPA: hypothetical protein GYA07_01780 [Verrucomicrobia bacterium]|nr:hypothetical protein [Verrucomicrobiota bacterium]HOB33496.1 hypothetical protein [Verrucomicrobiota bacterium]HOP97487.1 hypothetical protein [Verrucomicrobiota bacterium]